MDKTILAEHGIDYDAGVRRFMDDSALYEEMLCAFCREDELAAAEQAFRAGDTEGLFMQAHAIKGVSGNLDMPALYRASGMLTEALRNHAVPPAAQLEALFSQMARAHRSATAGIKEANSPDKQQG